MSYAQRLLVIVSLVMVGFVLGFLMLDWGDQFQFFGNTPPTRVLIFYERQDPQYRSVTNEMGIYTKHGVTGILLGVIAPLCLFAGAVFVALGTKARE